MNYEQKYNEALDAARHIYEDMKSGGNFGGMEDLEVIFPELAESEDERIRKTLLDEMMFLKEKGQTKLLGLNINDIIAYLEKLKEPTKEELYAEAGTTEKEYVANTMKKVRAMQEKLKEQLSLMGGNTDLYFDEWNQQQTKPPTKRQCFEEGMRYSQRLQKEQKPGEDSEYRKAYLDGWNARNLQAAREQKPAEWSEEDEKMLRDVYGILYAYQCHLRGGEMDKDAIELLDDIDKEKAWLKSLRPTWKPSEEQMEALQRASTNEYLSAKQFDKLVSLYEQLKAL